MNWKTELENFIASNVENNFPSIQTKRSSLAACVTKACNIAAKTQEEATRSQTFQEDEVKQNIHLVNEAIGILKHTGLSRGWARVFILPACGCA